MLEGKVENFSFLRAILQLCSCFFLFFCDRILLCHPGCSWTSGLKWSSCLNLLRSWDSWEAMPPCLASSALFNSIAPCQKHSGCSKIFVRLFKIIFNFVGAYDIMLGTIFKCFICIRPLFLTKESGKITEENFSPLSNINLVNILLKFFNTFLTLEFSRKYILNVYT